MNNKLKIIGISGSLRRDSFNTKLLDYATKILPEEAEIEVISFENFPLFNQDLENQMPQEILDFKQKIEQADAVLIVTPEYNYSVPGGLKNAIDWASRPYGKNSFEEKPVAIMSTSTGIIGGARAQYHLRQSMVFLNAHPMNKPEAIVPQAPEKFNQQGELIDEFTKQKIKEFIEAFIVWIKRMSVK